MTISSSTRKAGPFLGNGVTSSFPFTFKCFSTSDIQVIKTSTVGVDATLVLNSDYSVALNADQNASPGGSIIFPLSGALLQTGEKLTATGVLSALQQTHITNGGNFFANNIEDQMDYLTILIQQLAEQLARVALASSSDVNPVLSIGTAVQRALKYITFDAQGNLSLATSLPSATLSASTIGSFLYPPLPSESGITIVNGQYPYGYVDRYGTNTTPGTTDMTQAILNAIAAMPASGGSVSFLPGALYAINSANLNGLNFSGKTNFKVFGNNATIKVLSGQSVVGGNDMMSFTTSTDGYIENLFLDANRAGRVPNASGAYNVRLQNNAARLHFKKVRCLNSVEDGWILTTSVIGTQSTYPTDITLEDCSSDNAYRNGASLIGSVRCKIIRGSYTNTNGTSPQNGIDVEPDVGVVFGNTDLLIQDVDVSGNANVGIVVTGPNTCPNTNVVIAGIRASLNANGAIQIAQATGAEVRDCLIENHVGSASLGVVHIGDATGNASNVRLNNLNFVGLTSAGSAAGALNVTSNAIGPIVLDNLKFNNVACQALILGQTADVRNVHVKSCTSTSAAIAVNGARSVLRNVVCDTTTGTAVIVTGADVELDGVTSINYGASASAGIQFEAGSTNSVVRNVTVLQTSAIPGGTFAIRFNGVSPLILRNVHARCLGTDYTAANIFSFLSGTAGANISDCVPDPYRATVVWNPGTIANGAQASTTVALTGLALGDLVFAAPGVALGTITYSAQYESPSVARLTINNNSGAGVTPGSGTWTVWAEKR